MLGGNRNLWSANGVLKGLKTGKPRKKCKPTEDPHGNISIWLEANMCIEHTMLTLHSMHVVS